MGARVSELGVGGGRRRGGEQGIGVGGGGEDRRGERVVGVGEGIGHGAPVVGVGVGGSGGVAEDEGLHLFLGGVEAGILEALVLRTHHLRIPIGGGWNGGGPQRLPRRPPALIWQ